MISSIKLWFQAKYDYVAGGGLGAVSGVANSHLQSIAELILISILTGAAGAFGAHLFKLLINKINSKLNGAKKH